MTTFTVFTRFRITRLLASAAAATVLGFAPAIASADGHDHYRHDDNYDHRDTRRDLHVDVEINRDADRCEPRYEERETRVWVEPSYRTVCDKRWVEPETRTVCDRVWHEAVVEDRIVCRYVKPHWEVRDVVREDGCVRHEKVFVNGHDEKRHEQVVVCPGRWEDVQRQEVVCPGHWEECQRQELACPGHWEERSERVAIERHHDRDGLDLLAGIVAHIER